MDSGPCEVGEVGLSAPSLGLGEKLRLVTHVSSGQAHSGPDAAGSHQGNLKGPEKG